MANDLRPVVVKPLTDSSAIRQLFRRCFTYKLQSGRKNRADSAIFIPLPPDFICTNIKIVEMKADGKEDGGWEGRTQSSPSSVTESFENVYVFDNAFTW